jgi:hypothetical protein
MLRRKMLPVIGLMVFFSACKKEIADVSPPPEILTEKQQARVEVLKDVSSILLEVYKDPIALYEVNAAIYSEYYEDETVLLKDLLYPEWSRLYQTEKFKALKPRTGVFRSKFIDQFNKAAYPHLRKALGNSVGQFELNGLSSPTPGVPDTAMEIFSNSAGANIYFPYSENFGSYFTPAWFDNVNTDPFGVLATIVTADRDADSGPGQSARKTYVNGEPTIRYQSVTVNDVYAERYMTHIIGIGADPALIQQPPPPALSPGVNRVFIGEVKCNYNYDKLISVSGQNKGGGNDVQIMRISGYLQTVNSQVTSTIGDLIPIRFKRKDANNHVFKRVFKIWDEDWRSDNFEQVLLIYEDDDNVTKTVTGSVSTTLTASTGNTVSTSIGYSSVIPNADVIMRQMKISRNGYFATAWFDQGWGYRPDLTFLPSNSAHGWAIYEGADTGTLVSWTWPYSVY